MEDDCVIKKEPAMKEKFLIVDNNKWWLDK